jgi:DNA-directed RNA polymerase subunit M/transcription elongation factor TFIIS
MLPKIDVPVYETTLISTGNKIRFRPFLVKEQKIFLMASQSDDSKEVVNAIKQVISNCVIDDINVETLPTFDLENIFLQLRARSVGEKVELNYVCNNSLVTPSGESKPCGAKVQLFLNLLEVQPKTDPEHNKKVELTPKLGIVMKYPNFEILNSLKIESQSDLIKIIVACIDYIYDSDQIYYAKDSTETELTEFIENMQQSDVEKIQKFFETMPKISKQMDFHCAKCGYKENMIIEGIQNFFG